MSFQPFAVQCLTCGSQLRISDPSIVGTIAACPKCSSMVQIDRPDGHVEIGRSGVDSQAITEESISADARLSESHASRIPAEGFAGSESLAPENADGMSGAIPPDWQSSKTQRSRQIALVIALSATGLLAALVFFGWFVYSWGQQRSQQVATAGAETELGARDPTNSDPANSDPANSDPANSDPTNSDPANSDPANSDPNIGSDETTANDNLRKGTVSSIDDDGTNVGDRGTDPRQSTETTNSTQEPNGISETGLNAQTDPVGNPASPITSPPDAEVAITIPSDLLPPSALDPLGDPTTAAKPPATAGSDDPDADPGMQELPPELAKYTQFLLDDGGQTKPTLKAPPTMEEVKIEAAAEEEDEDLRIPITPKSLNLKADLAIRLALASDGYPASDLMLLVSQVSGVPIQMDWLSFDLAGMDIEQRVPTTKAWLSAREIINETATALQAEIREKPTLLNMTLRDEVFHEFASKMMAVDDFGAGSTSASRFLEAFLLGQDNPADPRQSIQLASLATEALRRMRDVAPRMDDERFGRWARSVTDADAEWTVLAGGEAGPQVDAPITVAGLLRRTARLNQATCVFNWHDAVRRGAPPERLVLPHAEANAGSTLSTALLPLGLQVRQVDPKHWWVGTEASYDRFSILVWTPPLGDSRDAFVERINNVMAGASPQNYRLAIDDTSGRALMLLPRFIVRQLPTIAPSVAITMIFVHGRKAAEH